ncbi:MAG: prepilin-type N-terminal cleavage/methylation domain-containing protein, partial [Phycisphaerae bacterium]|nr:prepilin-type N-terminal cleavage/methylation domain-containing protein [Phycisphaerae bacterium]
MRLQGKQSSIRRKGLTLIELMAAVAVLAMMILIFNMVLSQSQKVVYTVQVSIDANRTASAVEHVIRSDIRRLSKNGFLCITQADDGSPQLFYATAGPTLSLTGGDTGTGSFTAMGLCDYASAAGEEKLLWRAAWVLNEGTPSQASDCWDLDFADVQKCARADLN